MNEDVQSQLRQLLELAVMQGRIEGVTAATNTIGGFIALAESGSLGEDWLDQLKTLRNGMSNIVLQAEFDNTERIERA